MEHRYQSRTATVAAVYCIAVGWLMMLAAFSAHSALPARIAVPAVGFVLVLYGGLRARRLGVYVDDRGVVLRGYVRDRRFAWDEVEAFEVAEGWPYSPFLLLSTGTRVKTLGLGGSGVRHSVSMERTRQLVAALNSEIKRHPA